MSDYPSTQVPQNLKAVLERIPKMTVPGKADKKWLSMMGYRSANDASLVSAMKFFGLIDKKCAPTDLWTEYRVGGAKTLANILREKYSDLYDIHPDAHEQPPKILEHFFRAKTNAGDVTVVRQLRAFLAIASISDFSKNDELQGTAQESNGQEIDKAIVEAQKNSDTIPVIPVVQHSNQDICINLNLQLTLPESTDAKLLEQLFFAMNKYLIRSN